jgi:hypothetical protein
MLRGFVIQSKELEDMGLANALKMRTGFTF